MKKLSTCILACMLFSCSSEQNKAHALVEKTIARHGGAHLIGFRIAFDFRGRSYTAERTRSGYRYTRAFDSPEGRVVDYLVNSTEFVRTLNGDTVQVADTMEVKYISSVNSVLYFAQLPYLLNDPAAIKTYAGRSAINERPYHAVKVTFREEGGGKDFDDKFIYWIHPEDFTLDFFAYSYETDGGGVRFREAINRTETEGIVSQDYVNYEVPIGTPLPDIPKLFDAGKLKQLSIIRNENFTVEKL